MPIVIKEINVKVNVEDKSNAGQNTNQILDNQEFIEKIAEKVTKKVLKEIKQSAKR